MEISELADHQIKSKLDDGLIQNWENQKEEIQSRKQNNQISDISAVFKINTVRASIKSAACCWWWWCGDGGGGGMGSQGTGDDRGSIMLN